MRLAAVFALALVASASASAVQAASIVQTVSLAPTNLPSATSTTLQIGQFNDAMGTLLSIKVELSGTSDGTLRVVRGNNGYTGNITYFGTVGVDYDLSLNSSSILVVDVQGGVTVLNVPRNNIARTGTAASGSGGASTTFSDAGSLALFSGTGLVSFDLGLAPANSVDSMTPANVNQTTGRVGTQTYTFTNTASAELQVTYTYLGIPEPVSLSLFGMSLLGLGLVRRVSQRV